MNSVAEPVKFKKSSPILFSQNNAQGVDRENGIIKGVVIVSQGLDKNGDNIDEIFIDQTVAHGNSYSQGVKSRYGHPNMCDSAMGTYIGRYKNFSKVYSTTTNEQGQEVKLASAIADLYLDPVSKTSPKGNLYDYCLDMAESNSDMFGNSIHFAPAEREVVSDKSSGEEKLLQFIRMKSLIASDLVDTPAATSSLFKSENDFALNVTEFLDDNPAIFDLVDKNPGIIKSFLDKYSIYKQSNNPMENSLKEKLTALRDFFTGGKKEEVVVEIEDTGDNDTKVIQTDKGPLYCQSDIAVGAAVYADPAMTTPAPAGVYNTADGDYTIDDAGTVATLPAVKPEEPAPVDMGMVETMKSEISTLNDKVKTLTQMISDNEQIMKGSLEALENAKEQILELTNTNNTLKAANERTEEQIRETIKSEFTPEGSKRSSKSHPSSEPLPGGRFGPTSPKAIQSMIKTGSEMALPVVETE